MRYKVKLEQVRYTKYFPKPVFSGYYQGKRIGGNKEQLISSLAHIIAPEPQPTSKKARVIPGTEKLFFKGEIVECIETIHYFDFFDQRKDYKYVKIDLDKRFPEDYFKHSIDKIEIEVTIEITDIKWDFQTTRKRLKNVVG